MRQLKGSFILLTTAIIWGSSFVTQKLGANYIEPFAFNALRFLLGALALLLVISISSILKGRSTTTKYGGRVKMEVNLKKRDLLVGGALCGCAVFLGASAQQWGIAQTTAGKAGFITALYIVIVPVMSIFMGKRPRIYTWIGVAMALVGLYLLTVQEGLAIQKGDAIVLVGTVFWALQIILVDLYVDRVDNLKLSLIQFLTAGILSAIASIVFENPKISHIIDCAFPILYTAIMVVGVAYTLQIIGQRYINSTVSAIILSMEALFAAISGAVFLHESMTIRELLGCFLMVLSIMIAQVEPKEALEVSSTVQDSQ